MNFLPDLFMGENALLSYYDQDITVGDLGCRFVIRDGKLYFAVAGTNNIGDWLLDLKAEPVTRIRGGKPVRIEKGFADGAESLFQPVETALTPYKSFPIYASFHSLGCPLGRQITCYLMEQGFAVNGRLCLESPNTGDMAFEEYDQSFGIPTLFIRHAQDGVCVIPPTNLGYVEPKGDTLILGSDGVPMQSQDFASGWEIISRLAETISAHNCGGVLGAFRKWRGFQGTSEEVEAISHQ